MRFKVIVLQTLEGMLQEAANTSLQINNIRSGSRSSSVYSSDTTVSNIPRFISNSSPGMQISEATFPLNYHPPYDM